MSLSHSTFFGHCVQCHSFLDHSRRPLIKRSEFKTGAPGCGYIHREIRRGGPFLRSTSGSSVGTIGSAPRISPVNRVNLTGSLIRRQASPNSSVFHRMQDCVNNVVWRVQADHDIDNEHMGIHQ